MKTELLYLAAPPISPIPDKGLREKREEGEKKESNVRIYSAWWERKIFSPTFSFKIFLVYNYANNARKQSKNYISIV